MSQGYLAVKLTALAENGLRDYLELYDAVAANLRALPDFRLHVPHRVTNPNGELPDNLSASDVYLLDRVQVTHSDVVVACLELPSFGVGAELQLATDFGIPVVGFYYAEAAREPSRLALGMPSMRLEDGRHRVVRYTPGSAGRSQLLGDLATEVLRVLRDRPHRPAPTTRNFARFLDRRRQELKLTPNELAVASGVATGTAHTLSLAGGAFSRWIESPAIRRALSIDPSQVDEDRVLLPSFDAIVRIADALGVKPVNLFAPSPVTTASPG